VAFTYDITTDRGKVRLLIGDIIDVGHHFEDDEIDAFLTMSSNSILIAAGYALEAWASALTDSLTSESIGDYAYTKKDAETKRALALEYKKQEAESPILDWGSFNLTDTEE
jgi:hypothetical protein